MTKVKICGITNLGDALHAVECGADILGFNFYRQSKRYVEPSAAAGIASGLVGAGVLLAGVFVNAEPEHIADIVNEVGLHTVQLHGDETAEFVLMLRALLPTVEIIKAMRVTGDLSADDVHGHGAHRVLLDGDAGAEYGGAGKHFDWSTAVGVENLILAGGLTPESVAAAIRIVRPYAVDVASGVESSPGKKDPLKVAAFIKAAKEAI
jgi:phosphoribosylanthranilate isomerase